MIPSCFITSRRRLIVCARVRVCVISREQETAIKHGKVNDGEWVA